MKVLDVFVLLVCALPTTCTLLKYRKGKEKPGKLAVTGILACTGAGVAYAAVLMLAGYFF